MMSNEKLSQTEPLATDSVFVFPLILPSISIYEQVLIKFYGIIKIYSVIKMNWHREAKYMIMKVWEADLCQN